jgi:hypothetical protein
MEPMRGIYLHNSDCIGVLVQVGKHNSHLRGLDQLWFVDTANSK